jgi:hypothetical protein
MVTSGICESPVEPAQLLRIGPRHPVSDFDMSRALSDPDLILAGTLLWGEKNRNEERHAKTMRVPGPPRAGSVLAPKTPTV